MKAIVGAIAVLGVVMTGIALSGSPDVAKAATISFSVQAAGANEVPAVSSGGAANAQFTFDTETNVLTYILSVTGVPESEVTAAHIHRGEVGENGDVAYPLAEEGFTQTTGTVTLSDDDVELLFSGGLYVNVHSEDFPEGFARGQMILPEGAAPDEDDEDEDAEGTPGASPTATGTSPVTPPNTGDGGLSGGSGMSLLLPAALLVALLGIGSGAVLIRSRA
jgi:hypothetical protein